MEKGNWVMMKTVWLALVFASIFTFLDAVEFLYPVASISPQCVYLIYQKTPHHIELWEWDPISHHAEQILLSRFTPAGLRVLPGGRAFSFVDNGIIKIKQAHKRSPRTVELDAPISRVELINWIDDIVCYTGAEYRGRYGIFQIDVEGTVSPVCMQDSVDCLYPQKVGDQLFYIERDLQQTYKIMKSDYRPAGAGLREFYARLIDYQDSQRGREAIIDFGLQPIIFLYMISEGEGFVLDHQKVVSKRDDHIVFRYHHLKGGSAHQPWQANVLFSFTIPTGFLFTGKSTRLYEALLPLLPRHIGNHIYFCDAGEGANLSLFKYDPISQHVIPFSLLAHDDQHFFAPIQLADGSLTYGGFLSGDPAQGLPARSGSLAPVAMGVREGGITVSLPSVSMGEYL